MIITHLGNVECVETCTNLDGKQLAHILSHCWEACIRDTAARHKVVMTAYWLEDAIDPESEAGNTEIHHKLENEIYIINKILLRTDGAVEYYCTNGRVTTITHATSGAWGVKTDSQSRN